MERRTLENPVIGDRVTFIRTSDETDGEVTEIVVELAPGGGNEPHYHTSFTETFTALEGGLGVQAGTEERVLQPGQTATVSPGTVHRFFNPSDQVVRFRGEARPGRLAQERFIEIAYGLASDGRVNRKGFPRKLSHIALLMELGDLRMPGRLFRIVEPVLRWVARRARARGVEQELIDRYCASPTER